ncbi:unnamed protein product [Heterobilharzia americana]|nr:unnamed protein product [Heterobilharzia americana]
MITFCVAESIAPLYTCRLALPEVNPPPYIHTMTGSGRLLLAAFVGVHTLRYKQSSLISVLLIHILPAGLFASNPSKIYCQHVAGS